MPKDSDSFTRISARYIAEHSSVRDCLARGLINYSALAREICKAQGIKNFDAVQIACRRHKARIKAQSQDQLVHRLVKKAQLRVRNRMAVVVLSKPEDFGPIYEIQTKIKAERGDFNIIEGDEAVTIVTNEDRVPEIVSQFKSRVKKTSVELVQIAMIFDRKIETTSGVVAFVYSLLADAGVNVLEESSCWTDIMMVIQERDLVRAMKVLSVE